MTPLRVPAEKDSGATESGWGACACRVLEELWCLLPCHLCTLVLCVGG